MNKRGEAAPCTSRENNQAKEEQSRKEKKDWNKPAQLSEFLEVNSGIHGISSKILSTMIKLKLSSLLVQLFKLFPKENLITVF